MGNYGRWTGKQSARLLAGMVIAWVIPLTAVWAEEGLGRSEDAPAAVAPVTVPALRLEECIQIALEKQPALAAHRATLASAEAALRGLNSLHVPPILAGRELPIRRKQAAHGITIASAGLNQVEWETIYAVKRTYYTAVFTLEQRRVAEDVVGSLKATFDAAKGLVEGGSRDVTKDSLDQITSYLRLAEIRLIHAEQGTERALAGLREAMGVDHDYCLRLADDKLPVLTLELTREQAVALALARRGELVQASSAAAIACLEIEAQGATHLPTARTFAAGSDIHARPIPQGISNTDYRPGAIGLEMPTLMVGMRWTRVDRARDLAARADAVVDKTRHLIALETEDAFLKWQEAGRVLPLSREAADKAYRVGQETQKSLSTQNVRVKDVLDTLVHGEQSRARHNEALHQYLLGLAALERVTSGGISFPH